jgi:hypothetical protein
VAGESGQTAANKVRGRARPGEVTLQREGADKVAPARSPVAHATDRIIYESADVARSPEEAFR